ncbi:MAG: hypothetical protein Q9157_003736 [Trypethelium eluteriae]
MSAPAETEKKQTKRKRSSKTKSVAEGHERKRLKSDHGSVPHENATVNTVNGGEEGQDEEAVDQTNGLPKSETEKSQHQSHGSKPSAAQERKRESDAKGKKINGFGPQSEELQRGPEKASREESSLSSQGPGPEEDERPSDERKQNIFEATDTPETTALKIGRLYMILAHRRAVHIYSVSSSVLVRTLPASKAGVSVFALSAANANNIYIATTDGVVFLWNWVTGTRLGRWELQDRIAGIWASIEPSAEEDTVFTIDRSRQSKHYTITAHRLRYGSDASKTTSVTLLQSQQKIQGLKVLHQGEVIIAFFSRSLVLGQLNRQEDPSFEAKAYVWREMDCFNEITAFDARVVPNRKGKSKDYKKSTDIFVDVVIGTIEGPIFIYSDLLNKLISHSQKKPGKPQSSYLDSKRFHWHRQAVGTVKWSRDGNYLISGGTETVLVLWQLETMKKQFLPHLTAEIESLVVSPSGAAYAVRLTDNSLIVLSTSELKAKTHVAGIQAQGFIHKAGPTRAPKTVTTLVRSSKDPLDSIARTPATFSPLATHHLLLAVPSCQPTNSGDTSRLPAPYLQTFNIRTAHHVARQALTRNNATNFNIGPEGNRLDEPNVKMLRVSCDGKWLATVDKWVPFMLDTDFLATNRSTAREEQARRREVYLKFWRWNEKEENWMLETRVDAPHQAFDGMSAGNVDDLVSDPKRVGFSTVGEDGVVRIWRPRTTYPNNRTIRGVHPGGVVNWSCQSSSRLVRNQDLYRVQDGGLGASSSLRARLACSPDGSVLAACQSPQDEAEGSLLHLIDTNSGAISYLRTIPTAGWILGVGLLDKHVVVLSNRLVVWDPVEDVLVYDYDIDLDHLTKFQRKHFCHIATSPSDGTFALALSHVRSSPERRFNGSLPEHTTSCNVLVFRPTDPNPIFASKLSQLVTALIPGPQSRGFAIIDASAELRILTESTTISVPTGQPIVGPNESLAELEEIDEAQTSDPLRRLLGEENNEASRDLVLRSDRPRTDDETNDRENGDPIVRSEKLADILDAPSSSGFLPVRDMFNLVVGLYAQKPRTLSEGGPLET